MLLFASMNLFFQSLLPQKFLSYIVGIIAKCRISWIKNALIRLFIRFYAIDLSTATQKNISEYPSFNAFFIRTLDESTRTILCDDSTIIAPADGIISEFGKIDDTRLIQAKGLFYTLFDLLKNTTLAACFNNGSFVTIYLSPKNYHRVHLPFSGNLHSIRYFPGRLFSVNTLTTNSLKDLYIKNERVSCLFETKIGNMIVILVGALLVSGINTTWTGHIASYAKKTKTQLWQYDEPLKQASEIGFFEFGSTVIVLFEKDKISWIPELKIGSPVSMGSTIACLL